jgi:hypothetical protein
MRFPHGCNDQPQFVLGLPTRLEGADGGGVTTGAGGRRTAEEHPPQSQATARPLTPRLRLQLHAFPRHPAHAVPPLAPLVVGVVHSPPPTPPRQRW